MSVCVSFTIITYHLLSYLRILYYPVFLSSNIIQYYPISSNILLFYSYPVYLSIVSRYRESGSSYPQIVSAIEILYLYPGE